MYTPEQPEKPLLIPIPSQDNPLHVSLFPPYSDSTIEFSFLLNSCLDIFEIRRKNTSVDQDLGLLQAIDERLAAYGWLTTTGVKLLIIVDLIGQDEGTGSSASPAISGLRDSDLKPVGFPSYKATLSHSLTGSTGLPSIAERLYPTATEPVLLSR
jgi:hypothetical protein